MSEDNANTQGPKAPRIIRLDPDCRQLYAETYYDKITGPIGTELDRDVRARIADYVINYCHKDYDDSIVQKVREASVEVAKDNDLMYKIIRAVRKIPGDVSKEDASRAIANFKASLKGYASGEHRPQCAIVYWVLGQLKEHVSSRSRKEGADIYVMHAYPELEPSIAWSESIEIAAACLPPVNPRNVHSSGVMCELPAEEAKSLIMVTEMASYISGHNMVTLYANLYHATVGMVDWERETVEAASKQAFLNACGGLRSSFPDKISRELYLIIKAIHDLAMTAPYYVTNIASHGISPTVRAFTQSVTNNYINAEMLRRGLRRAESMPEETPDIGALLEEAEEALHKRVAGYQDEVQALTKGLINTLTGQGEDIMKRISGAENEHIKTIKDILKKYL